jgi:hypothetical protein
MSELLNTITGLTERLTEALLEQENLVVEGVEVVQIINRPYSDVYFLRVGTAGGDRRLVLKKTVHHQANLSITAFQNQALVEYNALCELYPAFQAVPRCRVPKPILVLPEQEAYVMDFVEGRLLGEFFGGAKIGAPKKSFEELRVFYFLSGVWLKKLHDFSGVRQAGHEAFSYTLDRCEQRLKMIEEANHPACPEELAARVRAFLDNQLRLVNAGDIWVTGRHGDFGSWNVMAGPDGITVFDFLGYQDDLLPVDFLKMLMNFEVERKYLFFSTKKIDLLETAFIEGYGKFPHITAPVLYICETLHRVCSLSGCVTAHSGNPLRRIERSRIMLDHISWFMDYSKKPLWMA